MVGVLVKRSEVTQFCSHVTPFPVHPQHVFGGCYLEPESRPRASIPCSLYSRYFCAGAHWLLVGLVMLFCLAAQVRVRVRFLSVSLCSKRFRPK